MTLSLLLIFLLSQVQADLDCEGLASRANKFDYDDLIGSWNVVFTYTLSGYPIVCKNVTFKAISQEQIEQCKIRAQKAEKPVRIAWNRWKLNVTIYKGRSLHQNFVLEETARPGRFHGARIHNYLIYDELMELKSDGIQLNVVQGYLVGMSCKYSDVSIHARGWPHATQVERLARQLGIPERSGRPVCVPGTVEWETPLESVESSKVEDKEGKESTKKTEL